MNQPTREEFEELKEEVRQMRGKITEPMKAVRVEVASEDALKRLETMDKKLDRIDQKQDEHVKALLSHSKSISTFQNQVYEVSARFDRIGSTMATREDLATLKIAQDAHFDQLEAEQKQQHEMLRQILRLLGQKPPES